MIEKAKFIKGIKGSDPILEDGRSHIAFIGRSNVGKSSVINAIFSSKDLVKSSSRPGKTTEINLFQYQDKYFVDLPGYGFAKLSEPQREKLRKMIIWYFTSKEASISLVVLIIDSLVGPTDMDKEMLNILRENNLNVLVLANKSDKLPKSKILNYKKKIEGEIVNEVLMFSATKKTNLENLRNIVFG